MKLKVLLHFVFLCNWWIPINATKFIPLIVPLGIGFKKIITNSIAVRQNGVCLNHAAGEFVRNPDDCKLFYFCLGNGEAVMASCPPTMLFNDESHLCDTPENASCNNVGNTGDNDVDDDQGGGDNNNSNNNEPTEQQDANEYCATLLPEQDVSRIMFIGSLSNCQRYYICYYGQALLQECSANLHWNAVSGKCDLPAKSNCHLHGNNGHPLMSSNVGGSGSINGGNAEVGETGHVDSNYNELINCPTYGQHIFPHMDRCDFFVYCVKGHAILQQCPFYKNFDVVSKSCQYRTSALCVRDLNLTFRKFWRV